MKLHCIHMILASPFIVAIGVGTVEGKASSSGFDYGGLGRTGHSQRCEKPARPKFRVLTHQPLPKKVLATFQRQNIIHPTSNRFHFCRVCYPHPLRAVRQSFLMPIAPPNAASCPYNPFTITIFWLLGSSLSQLHARYAVLCNLRRSAASSE